MMKPSSRVERCEEKHKRVVVLHYYFIIFTYLLIISFLVETFKLYRAFWFSLVSKTLLFPDISDTDLSRFSHCKYIHRDAILCTC